VQSCEDCNELRIVLVAETTSPTFLVQTTDQMKH